MLKKDLDQKSHHEWEIVSLARDRQRGHKINSLGKKKKKTTWVAV